VTSDGLSRLDAARPAGRISAALRAGTRLLGNRSPALGASIHNSLIVQALPAKPLAMVAAGGM
jgi:hypothetical protein